MKMSNHVFNGSYSFTKSFAEFLMSEDTIYSLLLMVQNYYSQS